MVIIEAVYKIFHFTEKLAQIRGIKQIVDKKGGSKC
jgi:hypothetical protein